MTSGSFMIAFGRTRVTGQHDGSVLSDMALVVMPNIMVFNNAADSLRRSLS